MVRCLVCSADLVNKNFYCFKAADSCCIHVIHFKHEVQACDICHTIHVFCHTCQTFVQLIRRSVVMDANHDPTLYAWRDEEGKYHSTTIQTELTKYFKLENTPNTVEDFEKFIDTIHPFINKQAISDQEKREHQLQSIMDDISNQLQDDKDFSVADLNIFCLNPNDLRLIHPNEKNLAYFGQGFNILERAFAQWQCPHGQTIIEGHSD